MRNNNFLEEMRFFFPSADLSERLFGAVEAVRRRDQLRVLEDRDQVEEDADEYLNSLPPEERGEVASAVPPTRARTSEQGKVRVSQRFIAEELYHHLAFLARGPQAKEGKLLPVRDAVISGVGDALGLPRQEPLLAELADEFTGWLNDMGHSTTGWGNITLAEGNQLLLEEFPPHEGDAAVPKRVFMSRQHGSRRPAKQQLQAGMADSSG